MIKGGIPIGKAFGISLRLHYSWFIIFILITWALDRQLFPDGISNLESNHQDSCWHHNQSPVLWLSLSP